VVWKAIVNRDVPRLYVEAKAFLKLRAQRNKQVKATRAAQANATTPPKPAPSVAVGRKNEGGRTAFALSIFRFCVVATRNGLFAGRQEKQVLRLTTPD